MALLFKKKVFYHIPRTGGNYVRAIINGLGLKELEINRPHSNAIDNPELAGLESFTIIRPPLDWYKSYYRLREMTKHRKKNFSLGIHDENDTFEQFVEKMIDCYPCGYVTWRYLANIPFVTHILRTENLTEQIGALFKKWGHEIPKIKPKNVSRKEIEVKLSKRLEKRLEIAEKDIIYYMENMK